MKLRQKRQEKLVFRLLPCYIKRLGVHSTYIVLANLLSHLHHYQLSPPAHKSLPLPFPGLP